MTAEVLCWALRIFLPQHALADEDSALQIALNKCALSWRQLDVKLPQKDPSHPSLLSERLILHFPSRQMKLAEYPDC